MGEGGRGRRVKASSRDRERAISFVTRCARAESQGKKLFFFFFRFDALRRSSFLECVLLSRKLESITCVTRSFNLNYISLTFQPSSTLDARQLQRSVMLSSIQGPVFTLRSATWLSSLPLATNTTTTLQQRHSLISTNANDDAGSRNNQRFSAATTASAQPGVGCTAA